MFYHYLLVKLKSEADKRTAEEQFRSSMDSLVGRTDGPLNCVVTRNNIERSDGMDIIIRMDFEDRMALQTYLNSDLHTEAKKASGGICVASMSFFDSEAVV